MKDNWIPAIEDRLSEGRKYELAYVNLLNSKRFKEKYLELQLSCDERLGYRNPDLIMEHVQWIHDENVKRNGTLLDLGCGPGFYSYYFSKLGYECTGIEISEYAIRYANQYNKDTISNPNFICGNYLKIDFPKNQDLIIMVYSVFNPLCLTEAKALLTKIYQSLSEGGIFLLEALKRPNDWLAYQTSWYTSPGNDLYSKSPYLCLIEKSFDVDNNILNNMFLIKKHSTKGYLCYSNKIYFYDLNSYKDLFDDIGFSNIDTDRQFNAFKDANSLDFFPIIVRK